MLPRPAHAQVLVALSVVSALRFFFVHEVHKRDQLMQSAVFTLFCNRIEQTTKTNKTRQSYDKNLRAYNPRHVQESFQSHKRSLILLYPLNAQFFCRFGAKTVQEWRGVLVLSVTFFLRIRRHCIAQTNVVVKQSAPAKKKT